MAMQLTCSLRGMVFEPHCGATTFGLVGERIERKIDPTYDIIIYANAIKSHLPSPCQRKSLNWLQNNNGVVYPGLNEI